MSNPEDVLVPIVAIVVIFGLPISYLIVNRVFAHQERLEMIRRGVVPPPDSRWSRREGAYAAAPPQPGPYEPDYQAYGYGQWQADRALRKGITLAMIGFALLVGLSFINIGRPGPWLLGGLIPLFIGIAQVITAVLSGARLTPLNNCGAPPPPGRQPGPQQQYQEPHPFGAAPRDVPPGPYAWRPGPTTELERPAPPPDVK